MRSLAVALFAVALVACSGSSSGQSCSQCDSIAQTILQHGGSAATCNEPPPSFEMACQAYESCIHNCH